MALEKAVVAKMQGEAGKHAFMGESNTNSWVSPLKNYILLDKHIQNIVCSLGEFRMFEHSVPCENVCRTAYYELALLDTQVVE